MARALRINVFEYMDYRSFLKAAYDDLKKRTRGFSYRWFAQKCQMSSPNFLKLVIDGKRNLTPTSAGKFAAALELNAQETSFFLDLVSFNQATTAEKKNLYFQRIGKYRKHRTVAKLERNTFKYLSHWYYPAIRELVTCDDFQEDPEWIARQLRPTVTPAAVRKAITVLVKLGVLERDNDGKLRQAEPLLSTGAEIRSLAVANFHRQMIERASGSIEAFEPEDREISGSTIALSQEGFKLFKNRIHQLRAELLELSSNETKPTRVVQFNFQAFPLAIIESESKS